MANRRFGGGPQRGNRNFPQQQPNYQTNSVSPWQGGVAPNSSLSGGLLSQLSSPQQIALALTSLLQPNQHGNSNPPSLLSLNTSPFSSQDNYGSHNRFGNRGRTDFRRIEPYNKNRGNNNWRAETNRSRSGSNLNRNRNKDLKKPAGKNDKTQAKDEKQKDGKDSEDKVDETIDLSTDETRDEENKDKKRDWKEEKNTVEDMQTDNQDKENPDDLTEESEKKDSNKNREGRYAGVPSGLLNCFVCRKSMWDGESFQNHLRGKAHKQMLQSLEESFQITVNILRENMRLVEEKKMIELNRMHRNNRSYRHKLNEPESTCNMCDFKFVGKIIAHRKTKGHQRLKRFLHPNCEVCDQEFSARMEWVEHRFTPEHLRKLKEIADKTGGEDGAILEETLEFDFESLLEESLQTEDENPVLELSDDMSNFQNRIPAYIKSRSIATESLKAATGFLCELCDRFFIGDDVAQAHLKSERHYFAFIEAAKEKVKKIAQEKEAEERNQECQKSDVDNDGAVEDKSNGGNEMGKPKIPLEYVINYLKSHKNEIAKNLCHSSASVWTEISNLPLNKISPEGVYTFVKENRELYDPEEACNENSNTVAKGVSSTYPDVETEEVVDELSTQKDVANIDASSKVDDEKLETELESEGQKDIKATNLRSRSVRNDAGPKTKKMKK